MQLDRLWKYQEADMEVLQQENTMRRDPTRTKLIRLRNFVMEQTEVVQKMEAESTKTRGRIDQIEQQRGALEAEVVQGMNGLDENAYETLEQVQAAVAEAQQMLESLKAAERELKKMIADAQAAEKQLMDIRTKVAQAKQQYTTLKVGYDTEYAKQSAALEEMKKKRTAAAEGIDAELLKRYEAVRQQCTPPMAKLNGDRCGGCNMSLPAVVVKRVGDAEDLVECENCGRILTADTQRA